MITIKSQVTAQSRKDEENGSAPKSNPTRQSPSFQQPPSAGAVQRQSAFGGPSISPSASQIMQLQKTIGNHATAKLFASRMDSKTVVQRVVQRTTASIQREKSLPKPVTEVQVQPLLDLIESQRQKITDLQRSKEMSSDNRENLDQCFKKLTNLFIQMRDSDNPMLLWDNFTEWTETSAWSGGGSEYWETFTSLSNESDAKKVKEQEREKEKTSDKKAWSTECDAVFSDMNSQYGAWDGTRTNRGAWWGSARPGSTTGATNVPTEVIRELRKRVGGTGWRFSDSFSGGISFHKTRGGVDFIYHMLPPG
ncbi:hypothetical protein [Paenibacillus aceris]|uniref:Uncharacterized protein n=1 Tax=Paenibacillus aceris TaxID=869555 RepID=A0ABS4HXQ7_9BACL|nr:hypothetical protein [Paenibacillus aceris]MBP1963345.1 hypothetical protein [Paenibacillus aceris]NHW36148.1 hypothetical protein [Paenibacillus aceris]